MSKYKGNILSASPPVMDGVKYTGQASGRWTPQEYVVALSENKWVKALSIPDAPTGVNANAGDSFIDVTFSAPVDTGGVSITNYEVVISPTNVATTGNTSPIRVTGLTNNTTYSISVHAVNSQGKGIDTTISGLVPTALVSRLIQATNSMSTSYPRMFKSGSYIVFTFTTYNTNLVPKNRFHTIWVDATTFTLSNYSCQAYSSEELSYHNLPVVDSGGSIMMGIRPSNYYGAKAMTYCAGSGGIYNSYNYHGTNMTWSQTAIQMIAGDQSSSPTYYFTVGWAVDVSTNLYWTYIAKCAKDSNNTPGYAIIADGTMGFRGMGVRNNVYIATYSGLMKYSKTLVKSLDVTLSSGYISQIAEAVDTTKLYYIYSDSILVKSSNDSITSIDWALNITQNVDELLVDSDDNIYLKAGNYMIKINSSGIVQWQRSFSSTITNCSSYDTDWIYIGVSMGTAAYCVQYPRSGSKQGSYTLGGNTLTISASSLAITNTTVSFTTTNVSRSPGSPSLSVGFTYNTYNWNNYYGDASTNTTSNLQL